MLKLAVCETVPSFALTVAAAVGATALVVTVNAAEDDAPVILTKAGTVASVLFDDSVTATPAVGAPQVSVTVERTAMSADVERGHVTVSADELRATLV